MRPILLVLFCFTMMFGHFSASAQIDTLRISGQALDSLTHLPIPFAAIRNLSSGLGTFSDEEGKFSIMGSSGDTLTVSVVGYVPKSRLITGHRDDMIFILQENPQLLKTVTIYGSFKPQGQSEWKNGIVLPKTFRNPAGPGSGYGVETFGPGVSLSGVFSRFSKSEKEKRKLKSDREETNATQTYRNTITSPEVKTFFMETFSLTETEYSKKIEQFNIIYPEAAYLSTKDEIIKMLVNFFAEKKQ